MYLDCSVNEHYNVLFHFKDVNNISGSFVRPKHWHLLIFCLTQTFAHFSTFSPSYFASASTLASFFAIAAAFYKFCACFLRYCLCVFHINAQAPSFSCVQPEPSGQGACCTLWSLEHHNPAWYRAHLVCWSSASFVGGSFSISLFFLQ